MNCRANLLWKNHLSTIEGIVLLDLETFCVFWGVGRREVPVQVHF